MTQRGLEIKMFLTNVDFGKGINRIEYIPLSIGNEGNKSNGEGVLWTVFGGAAETKKVDEAHHQAASERDGFVFDTVKDIETKTELMDILANDKSDKNSEYDERNKDTKAGGLGEENETIDETEAKKIKSDRIMISCGIAVLVVKFFEDEGKNSLVDKYKNGIKGKIAIKADVHVHETNIGINVKCNKTVDGNRKDETDEKAGHDGVRIVIADFANISAGSKRCANSIVEKLKRVSDRKNINKIRIEDNTQTEPTENWRER